MKRKILIIEDNCYKYFTVKSLIESQLHIETETFEVNDADQLQKKVEELNPSTVSYRINGSAIEVVNVLKRKGANRRNTEILFVLLDELEMHECAKIDEFAKNYFKIHTPFAKVA